MGSMAEKICLDTDICVAIINGEDRAENFRDAAIDSELFLTSVTVFELYLRKTRLDKVSEFLNNFNLYVLPLDQNCALISSEIHKDLEKKGSIIEFRDIFIASIAINNNCTLATFNKKHFSKIKNLQLLDFLK